MNDYLGTLTVEQLARLWNRCWERMTRGDGSQPWGYDAPTLWLTKPVWMKHLNAIWRETENRSERDGR